MRTDPSEKTSRNASRTHIFVSALILAAAAATLTGLFLLLYRSGRNNILTMWSNNATQLARSTEYYLTRPVDAIEFTAIQVEDMMAQGHSNREIGQLLIREMEAYVPLVDSNYTGVYGYCRGEYLDASGWVPDPGYVPTQRPWYISAKEAGGQVAYVPPYRNLQTNAMMMSVSKLLSDGESVVSMDIFLDGLQELTAGMLTDSCVVRALILDSRGTIIAHSHAAGTGEGMETVHVLTDMASDAGNLVFTESIQGGWHAVLVLNEGRALRSVRGVNMALVLTLMITILGWYGISFRVHRKYREAEQLTRERNAVADIYDAMTLIDLKTGEMTSLRSNEVMEGLFEGDMTHFQRRVFALAGKLAAQDYRHLLAGFMDPNTYGERLKTTNTISCDFKDLNRRWVRVQLIVVDRDDKGHPRHLIWALLSIDEEYRQREKLRLLAETDTLTKIRNRRSGEAVIRQRLEEEGKGVFILVDVDKFKTVNDTYGHKVGDLVIVAIAERLRQLFREEDVVFRLGGDEFAVFLSNVNDLETGNRIALRVQADIANVELPELHGGKISVSVGAASFPEIQGETFDTLYQRADQRMYENKRLNRGETPPAH